MGLFFTINFMSKPIRFECPHFSCIIFCTTGVFYFEELFIVSESETTMKNTKKEIYFFSIDANTVIPLTVSTLEYFPQQKFNLLGK